MNFTPSTDKQKGLLSYMLREAHGGSYNEDVLPRESLEELKRLNEQGDIDKQDTSHLIDLLRDFNDAALEMNPRIVQNTKNGLTNILNRINRTKQK